ncbi:hypothetical protein Tco_1351895 [Tanacetum coccineum]
MEVEPLEHAKLEDLGLNTCSPDLSLSSREIPSIDEPEPQLQPLPNCPLLDVNLGDKRETDPPIKPHNDPKKHYGFKPGLLGQGGSLGVDLSNWEVIEIIFLRGISLPVKPIELEKGRKAHLLKDKQILSVGVFDKVFSTWMAFGGNTRDLGSFGEKTDKITDLHQIHEEVLFTEHRDDVAGIKRRRRDLSSDGVRDLAMVSGCGRLKEDLESST